MSGATTNPDARAAGGDGTPVLTPDVLDALRTVAEAQGLLRLSAVRLDHPGFSQAGEALSRSIAQGHHGEMEFMARTEAVRRDPTRMLPGANTLLVALAPHGGESSPVARYAQASDYHSVIHRRLEPVVEALLEALPTAQAMICVDSKPVMERAAAALAGLGFLGKNGCLIVPGLGSYMLLGEILTTAHWTEPHAPVPNLPWDACGSCTRCLDACPTNAFTAAGELDSRRCISYLTIEHRGEIDDALAAQIGERIAGCDVCQEVCPYNVGPTRQRRVPEHALVDGYQDGPRLVDLVALANARTGRYRAFVRDSALRRIPRRQLRRNAIIALGNREGPLREDEREALELAARDDEPRVAAAASWALRRRS